MDREKVIKGFECCMTDMNRSDSMPCRSCPYGTLPKKENCQKQMFADVYAMLKEQEAVRPQDAEMLIIHNGGAEEYVKDIESIVLLAHKDYDIVYCGKFSEGR